MKNFKKLSRSQLKSVSGGIACTLVVKQANGTFKTYSGTCTAPPFFGTGGYYCETGLGRQELTSNGGVSRCNE
ncbi:hypothetical protein HZP84_12365 [Elizabethkingia anophelis]|nr:hypothetical protein [Elizabethkingia anophelis]MCT3824070.1 hypothetical protein [Elizabethkingia anophelis]MCT3931387.1 hypothetical protein [Elizabethkingia anophelis]MCT4077244.1 hypothetical protein [Elizabethkingia anophelis]MCT4080925.1 hypothetical protein [Elizabethkingia anophelis]